MEATRTAATTASTCPGSDVGCSTIRVEQPTSGGRGCGGWLTLASPNGDTLSIEFRDLREALSLLARGFAAAATDGRVDVAAVDVGHRKASLIVRVDGSEILRATAVPARSLASDLRGTLAELAAADRPRP